MAELVASQKKQLGPSGLRHEVNPESADDERAQGHEQIQVPDSQEAVPETQLTANYGLDSDAPDSPNTRAVIERNHISNSKAKESVDAIPFNVMYLSKESFAERDGATSPVFAFKPLKPKGATSTAPGGGGSANAFPRPGAKAATETHEDVSGPETIGRQSQTTNSQFSCTLAESDKAKSHSQHDILDLEIVNGPVSDAARAVLAMEACSVLEIIKAEDAVGTPQETKEPLFAPQSAQPEQGARPAQKKTRSGGKKGKKSGKCQPQEQRQLSRPLPSGDKYTKYAVDCFESSAVDQQRHELLETDETVSSRTTNQQREGSPMTQEYEGASQDLLPGVPTDTQDSVVEISESVQTHPEDPLQGPECYQSGGQLLNVVREAEPPVPPAMPQNIHPSEAPLHTTATRGGANRVSKPVKKPRPGRGSQTVGSRLGALVNGSTMAPGIDSALQSFRVALLADQFRQEHAKKVHASEMEALQQANSALNQANDAHKGHIESMKAAETDLRAKMSLQTEKVRNMGKFLKGIGTDCDGFKANMKLQQEKCSSDLKKAIAEVQKDKVALEQDFLATVKTLEKSQRTMKQTLDECFVRLQISEARKKDLEDALKAKSLVCKEESDKRVRLEQQIMGSIQSLQSQVEEGQGSLVEKLGAVQASLDMMAPDESRDTLIQEYMTALKDFRETPLLTIKDVQKAEGMLQFLRTSLESKLGDLSSCFTNAKPSSEEFHEHVRDELGALKKDLIKFDEVHAQYLAARQSNGQLTQQLSAERSKCERLDEEIKELRQNETDFKARYTQLELELTTTKEAVFSEDSEPKKLLREMDILRGRLTKTEQDLQEANSKIDEAVQLQHNTENDAADCRKTAEESTAKLTEIVQHDKKRAKQARDYRKYAREQAMQEATRIIKEKKATFDNDLHRLTRERDDKESQLQSTAQELDATRTALQRSQRQIRDLESNAKELRRQKGEVESQLRKAERAAEGHATASSELDSVKEQLRSKTDALQTVETELKTVRKDLAASQKKAAGLQESHDQMQFDVSEKRSAVEQSNKDKVAVQNLQAQVRTLQQKNSDLQTNIDTLRSKDGSDLKDAQARFSVEKRRLEEQVKGLQSAKQSSEQELQRVQKEVADKSKETKTRYDADVASLKARLEQSSQAAKELEDKVKSVEERKERELEAHKKVSEKKIEEKFAAQAQAYQKKMEERLSEELQRQAEEAAKVHTYPNSQPDSSRTSPQAQSSQGPSTSLGTLSTMNIHAKPKKKVDRQNHSVFSVHSSASNVLAGSTPFPTAISAETAYVLHHHEDPEDHEETHPDELGAQEYLDEIVVSLREPPPGTVPDTQEVQLSFEQLNQLLMQRAADDQSSSSQLSEVNEELLDSLKPYDMAIPKGHARIAGRSPLKEMAGDQIVHSRHVLESPSRETDPHERPKSRANTASRMVPPGYQHPSDEASLRGQTTPKTGNGGRSRAMSHRNGDNTSSPDYVQKPSSSGPVTYGQHSGRSATSHVVPRGTWPLPSVDGSSHKRKSSAAHTDRTPSGKRSRVSPQYATAETPRRSQAKSNMPSSSAGSYNSQSQMRSSYASGKNSSAGSAARSGRTKKDRYDWRFAEELN